MAASSIAACRLYGFIDATYLAGRDPGDLTRQMIAGGVDIIQVRAKHWTRSRLVELAMKVLAAAAGHEVPVIVNDDIDVAAEVNADGIHLGQEDWAAIPRAERAGRLAMMRIIGLSTHSLAQAQAAERDGVNYIGVGPVFATATKPGVKPVGVELVRKVAARVHIPIFAIGGIVQDNIDQVLATGATRIAVVSAILQATDVKLAAQDFKRRLKTL